MNHLTSYNYTKAFVTFAKVTFVTFAKVTFFVFWHDASKWKRSAEGLLASPKAQKIVPKIMGVAHIHKGNFSPWPLPKNAPQPPHIFEGESLAGKQEQTTFVPCQKGLGVPSLSTECSLRGSAQKNHSIPLTVDRRHAFPSLPAS